MVFYNILDFIVYYLPLRQLGFTLLVKQSCTKALRCFGGQFWEHRPPPPPPPPPLSRRACGQWLKFVSVGSVNNNKLSLVGMQLPEKYKEKGPSSGGDLIPAMAIKLWSCHYWYFPILNSKSRYRYMYVFQDMNALTSKLNRLNNLHICRRGSNLIIRNATLWYNSACNSSPFRTNGIKNKPFPDFCYVFIMRRFSTYRSICIRERWATVFCSTPCSYTILIFILKFNIK